MRYVLNLQAFLAAILKDISLKECNIAPMWHNRVDIALPPSQ
jgi:hypothetical protein